MIYTVLPVGNTHGWGVCGKYLVRELAKKEPVRLVNGHLRPESFESLLDYKFFQGITIQPVELDELLRKEEGVIEATVLQAINNQDNLPLLPKLRGRRNIGYTFFEDNVLNRAQIQNAEKYYDVVVTGSTWCEEMLRFYGLKRVKTVIQGIDPMIFNPLHKDKEYFFDRFVVFSGGKFELRKGQDIVIKAYKVLQDRYDDVLLVTSWFNQWPQSIHTMSGSPYLQFQLTSNDFYENINRVLLENRIDLQRVIHLPLYPNVTMAAVYKNTDLGFFPNRCEGGTNLVMMEYMACGKPVLASYSSGHKDVINEKNAVLIKKMGTLEVSVNGVRTAVWDDPSLEEAVEKLDWAYHHREELTVLGKRAGEDLSRMTWEEMGQRFYEVILNQ